MHDAPSTHSSRARMSMSLVRLAIGAVAKQLSHPQFILPSDLEEEVLREEYRIMHNQKFRFVLTQLVGKVEPSTVRQTSDLWCQNCTRLINVKRHPPFPPAAHYYNYEWEYWECE